MKRIFVSISIYLGMLPVAGMAQAPQMPALLPTQAASRPPAPEPLRSTRAKIDFQGNRLTITADDTSLTQILGDIAHVTGMKITGGINDERVYGTYGPDTPQAVLTALLDGTGTNMLLLQSAQHTVQELILTPRNGGPSPPSISTSRSFDRDNTDQPPMPGGRRPGGFGPGRRFQPDPSATNTPESNQQQPNQPQTAAPSNDTTQQSPNGVKTPQQIYEQLMQQQRQRQPPTAPPGN